ncbi:MAG: zinc-ribbon domain-containing protein [Erysipelotrichaceae bacterium]|nr:zinc-ribbon domain-containing protein [Erysipelotrichaceae bacterium]
MKKCLGCGKDIPDDSIFCPFCGEEITQEKCSDNKETPTNKNDNVFKRMLSWIVLIVCFELMLFLYSVIFVLAEPVLIIFNSLSTIWKYAVILLGVSSFVFGLIFLPFTVGIPFVISLSEKSLPFRKRNKILGVWNLNIVKL